MGIHVFLDILPHRIEPAAWAAFYDETVTLLRTWPGGFVRHQAREVAGRRVVEIGGPIETGDGEARQWRIDGDGATLRTAETHEMYRALAHYSGGRGPRYDHILVAVAHDSAVGVLRAKTQGAPYHVALVAVAMLAEDRFPDAAAAGGDIDQRDIRQAADWIEQVLGRRPAPPVRLDAARLSARLAALQIPEPERRHVVEAAYQAPESAAVGAFLSALFGANLLVQGGLNEGALRSLAVTGSPDTLTDHQRISPRAAQQRAAAGVSRSEPPGV